MVLFPYDDSCHPTVPSLTDNIIRTKVPLRRCEISSCQNSVFISVLFDLRACLCGALGTKSKSMAATNQPAVVLLAFQFSLVRGG